MEAAVG